jgi:hypothetical protein
MRPNNSSKSLLLMWARPPVRLAMLCMVAIIPWFSGTRLGRIGRSLPKKFQSPVCASALLTTPRASTDMSNGA